MIPPQWIRRVVLAPLVVLAALFAATTLPLTAIVVAAIAPFLRGRWRPLRLFWFALVFLFVEAAGIIGCFLLWVASGFGWRIRAPKIQGGHETLIRWYLAVVVGQATRTFNVVTRIEGPDGRDLAPPPRGERRQVAAQGPPEARQPLLVLARHAGAGDSFLLVYALTRLRRHPRVVLKAALQWAPCLDIVLNRIPSEFVASGGKGRSIDGIGRLAAGLGPDDGLIIFPEGGNFTEGRRTRSIAKLEELGQHAQAEAARQLRYVLAPRPGGVLAALDAQPAADVVFVAHTGLEDLSGIVDLWRGLPMDSEIEVKLWHVPSGEVPTGRDERIAWLYDWWRRIDGWILERRGEVALPDELVAELEDGAR